MENKRFINRRTTQVRIDEKKADVENFEIVVTEDTDNLFLKTAKGIFKKINNEEEIALARTEPILGNRIPDNDIPARKLKTSTDADRIQPHHLSDAVKAMMTGDSPVSPVIGEKEVTREKMADKAVDYTKLDFGGVKSLLQLTSFACSSSTSPIREVIKSGQSIKIKFFNDLYLIFNTGYEVYLGSSNITAGVVESLVDGVYTTIPIPHNNCIVFNTKTGIMEIITHVNNMTNEHILIAHNHNGYLRGGAFKYIIKNQPENIEIDFSDENLKFTYKNIYCSSLSGGVKFDLQGDDLAIYGTFWVACADQRFNYYNYWGSQEVKTNMIGSATVELGEKGVIRCTLPANNSLNLNLLTGELTTSQYNIKLEPHIVKLIHRAGDGNIYSGILAEMQSVGMSLQKPYSYDVYAYNPLKQIDNPIILKELKETNTLDVTITIGRFYIGGGYNGKEFFISEALYDGESIELEKNDFHFSLNHNEIMVYNTSTNEIKKKTFSTEAKGNEIVLVRNYYGRANGGIIHKIFNDYQSRNISTDGNSSIEVIENNVIRLSKPEIQMIAHRGMSAYEPENTIPAYTLAGRMGYWGAECDVYETSDGHFILMHDDTLDRTTNGTGSVSSYTLEQLKQLKITGGNNASKYLDLKIPTLQEYLAECKRWGLVPVIEVKSMTTSSIQRMLDVINGYVPLGNCVIISFNFGLMVEIRKLSKEIILQPLLSFTEENIQKCADLGLNTMIDVTAGEVTKELIEKAHKKGVLVNCWTVNFYSIARELEEKGVDQISTDLLLSGPMKRNFSFRRLSKPEINLDYIKANMASGTFTEDFDNVESGQYAYKDGVLKVNDDNLKCGLYINMGSLAEYRAIKCSVDMLSHNGVLPKITIDFVGGQQGVGTVQMTKQGEYQNLEYFNFFPSNQNTGDAKFLLGLWTADSGLYEINLNTLEFEGSY